MAAARMLEFCYEIKSSSRWDRTGTRDGFVEVAGEQNYGSRNQTEVGNKDSMHMVNF